MTLTVKEFAAMSLDDLKGLAAGLGYDVADAQSVGQARAMILSSAVEFKNL